LPIISIVILVDQDLNIDSSDLQYYNSKTQGMNILIGGKSFHATLVDNTTSNAFKSFMPLTLEMIELNANEKYADLPKALPQKASNPGKIKVGDIMLYGSSTLVIFYKAFSTPYSYTPIGKIDNPEGLADVLGSGNVTVVFKLD
jgi:hypothetical protein